jgi:hypothetical protein
VKARDKEPKAQSSRIKGKDKTQKHETRNKTKKAIA